MIKSFETKIDLCTLVDDKILHDKFMIEFNMNPDMFYFSKIYEQESKRTALQRIPILLNKTGMNSALKGFADKYVKLPPKDLLILYDLNKKKDLLWIAPAKDSLVIMNNQLPINGKINYDKHGNLKMKMEDIIVRVTLKPDYSEINKKYEGILQITNGKFSYS